VWSERNTQLYGHPLQKFVFMSLSRNRKKKKSDSGEVLEDGKTFFIAGRILC
jgi:hypothetical protein